MTMDLDRLDAEPHQSIESDAFDYYADEQGGIVAVLDNDGGDDEHVTDFMLRSMDESSLEEGIWMDLAPPEHFSIKAGYFD